MMHIAEKSSFGKANRPQTPVKGIMQGDYGKIAEQEVINKYSYVAEARK